MGCKGKLKLTLKQLFVAPEIHASHVLYKGLKYNFSKISVFMYILLHLSLEVLLNSLIGTKMNRLDYASSTTTKNYQHGRTVPIKFKLTS